MGSALNRQDWAKVEANHEADDFFARLRGRFPPYAVPFLADGESEAAERNLAMVLAYDGTGFAGWQMQPGKRTIQGELERVLSLLCDEPVRVEASGRTDAGVHAWGQVASFRTKSRLSLVRLRAGLAALLPPEICLRRLGPVPQRFHARFEAWAKTYDYFLWPQAPDALFLRQRLWPLPFALDAGPIRRALWDFQGEFDFKALAFRGSQAQGPTWRRVFKADLSLEPSGIWRVRVTATGFLRHVIRNLVGVLAQVGAGRLSSRQMCEMLAAGQRLYSGPKAPPEGLYLNRVYYEDLDNSSKEQKP